MTGNMCTGRSSHQNKGRSLHKFISGGESFFGYCEILLSTTNT